MEVEQASIQGSLEEGGAVNTADDEIPDIQFTQSGGTANEAMSTTSGEAGEDEPLNGQTSRRYHWPPRDAAFLLLSLFFY